MQPFLDDDHLVDYANATESAGCPLENVIGFIDGTLIENCRPSENQQLLYNGKDKIHGLKYQSLMLPNGLTANLYGPVVGSRHDSILLGRSGLVDHFRGRLVNNQQVVTYADKAYALSDVVITPFRGVRQDQVEAFFNGAMNACRSCVEWGFGGTGNNFAFNQYPKNLKVLLQPVGLYYRISTLFSNLKNILHRNQTSRYFELEPPSLDEYLR